MKVIVAGGTGYIGGEILSQTIAHPDVTEVIILSRRALDKEYGAKARVVVIADFTAYSDAELAEMAGADACIWAIGTYNGNATVEIDYPVAFARGFAKTMQPGGKKTFRYVHLGGAFTERDQEKPLWFLPTARRVRGLAETKMDDFQQETPQWESYITKPGGVMKPTYAGSLICWLFGRKLSINLQVLAAAMVDVALHGDSERILYNERLVHKGEAIMQSQ